MPNPYKSPSNSLALDDRIVAAHKKLRIGTFCLGVAGFGCAIFMVFAAFYWYSGRNNEIQSAIYPLLPIMATLHGLLLISIGTSIYGLVNKRTWAINWGVVCLSLAGLSILFPVAVVGIWALIDSRIKPYFNQENA